MSTLAQIEKHMLRLERKVDMLNELRQKPKWVKATAITAITGWNKDKMLQARENDLIKFEKRDNGDGTFSFYYDLNTLDERLYKK